MFCEHQTFQTIAKFSARFFMQKNQNGTKGWSKRILATPNYVRTMSELVLCTICAKFVSVTFFIIHVCMCTVIHLWEKPVHCIDILNILKIHECNLAGSIVYRLRLSEPGEDGEGRLFASGVRTRYVALQVHVSRVM